MATQVRMVSYNIPSQTGNGRFLPFKGLAALLQVRQAPSMSPGLVPVLNWTPGTFGGAFPFHVVIEMDIHHRGCPSGPCSLSPRALQCSVTYQIQ